MSEFYYRQQRKEDISSLQAMFGPPWTADLLGAVLDHYDGNVDLAVNKLLVLNDHHKGNPTPLVDRLIQSGLQRQFGGLPDPTTSPNYGTTATIPKSQMKKPPPPRKVKVEVVTADGALPTTITISKSTRRRVGIRMELPVDFLRIPKLPQKPLFDPHHLDHLIDFGTPIDIGTPVDFGSRGPVHKDASSQPSNTQGIQSKLQALRASLNFPTFSKPETAAGNNHAEVIKKFFFLPGKQENWQESTGNDAANIMNKFSVPKMSAPMINLTNASLPKAFLRPNNGAANDNNALHATMQNNLRLGAGWSIGTALQSTAGNSNIDTSAVAEEHPGEIDTYSQIPHLELRGTSVEQLRQLLRDMERHCTVEQWKSVKTGQVLHPHEVSVYDLAKYYILPNTQAQACSYVEQAYGKHHNARGLPPTPKWFVAHSWGDTVFDLVKCIEQHAADRSEKGTPDEHSVYWISALAMNQHAVDATALADLDQLGDQSILQEPHMTQKVMQVTKGMLAVVDRKREFFSRIWCLWEVHLALELQEEMNDSLEDRYIFDVYSVNGDGVPTGLTNGFAETDKHRPLKSEGNNQQPQPVSQSDWSELRAIRQSKFCWQSLLPALDVNLESAHASLEADSRCIMNSIVQKRNSSGEFKQNEAEAFTVHPAYAYVNSLIRGTFAGMAYRHVLDASVADKDKILARLQCCLESSPITSLEVSFAGCSSLKIRDSLKFLEALPKCLRLLDLDYSHLDFQYAEEFAIGFSRLGISLQTLRLNFSFCCKLENLDRLWEELGSLHNLRCLVLVVHPNRKIRSVDGLATALSKMPLLETLQLEFDCFGEYSKLVAMAKGGATLNSISSKYRNLVGKSAASSKNQALHQRFDKVSKMSNMDLIGAYITDSSIQKLCRSLASRTFETKLASLKLRFLGDFGKKLKSVETIDDLQVMLQGIRYGLKFFS